MILGGTLRPRLIAYYLYVNEEYTYPGAPPEVRRTGNKRNRHLSGTHICHTIELPDRNNIPASAAYPRGAISRRGGNTRGMANRSAFRMC
ncbi:hypothetical protein BC792_11059 [Sphingobacterium allocomposti]|uniref:Uncharacterized protein n=1 Tax=Sphingobacterium allocomposti TaxID=415956 RepID=A0A5S5DIH3_9SPHI|nr:hypothetical protein BC792_11059 [Sphingobacterium composti Yoo et al. 2007 non Ten et al. 2007]